MVSSSIVKRFHELKHNVHKITPKHQHVRIVAVSKTYPPEAIAELHKSKEKHNHFGENYAQELLDKAKALKQYSDIKWHFIGHLQSNKAAALVKGVPNLWCVETVDRPKIALALQKAVQQQINLKARSDPLNVMVQVNTSDEAQKSGCMIGEVVPLVNTILYDCPALKFKGLMTIGSVAGSTMKHANPDFEKLVACRNTVSDAVGMSTKDIELSMGMSADYEQAVKQGSNNIRVGSAIFGPRNRAAQNAGAPQSKSVDKSADNTEKDEAIVDITNAKGDKTAIVAKKQEEKPLSQTVEYETANATVKKTVTLRSAEKPKTEKKGFQPADIDFDEQASPSAVPANVVAMQAETPSDHPNFNRPAEAPEMSEKLKEEAKKAEEKKKELKDGETSVTLEKKTKTSDAQVEEDEKMEIKSKSGSQESDITMEHKKKSTVQGEPVKEVVIGAPQTVHKEAVRVIKPEVRYATVKSEESTAEVVRVLPTIKRVVKRIDVDGKETIVSKEDMRTGEVEPVSRETTEKIVQQ